MLALPDGFSLESCATNTQTAATIVPLTRDLAKHCITSAWWTGLDVSPERRRQEPDHHWNWTKLVGEWRGRWYSECVAVQTEDGSVQAAAIYQVNTLSVLDSASDGEPAPAVYVGYLATAPRNRGWLVPAPAYRGGGTALLMRAAVHSYQLGFGGRVNLASLPHARTEAFYTDFGIERTEVVKESMVIYELRPEQAQAKLTHAGLL